MKCEICDENHDAWDMGGCEICGRVMCIYCRTKSQPPTCRECGPIEDNNEDQNRICE